MAREQYSQLRRRLLEPVAAMRGVDYSSVSAFAFGDDVPGIGEEEIVFGLLGCGADVLLSKTYADEFPARPRIARKGAKLVARGLGGPGSIAASSMFAQAQATLASERQRRQGADEDAVRHAACAGLVQYHYALPREFVRDLERKRAEAWQWADELLAREERGEEVPNNAAEAIAAHRFQHWTTVRGLQLVLGDWFDAHLDAMVFPDTGYDALILEMADAYSWGHIEERRLRFVRAACAMSLI